METAGDGRAALLEHRWADRDAQVRREAAVAEGPAIRAERVPDGAIARDTALLCTETSIGRGGPVGGAAGSRRPLPHAPGQAQTAVRTGTAGARRAPKGRNRFEQEELRALPVGRGQQKRTGSSTASWALFPSLTPRLTHDATFRPPEL